MTRAHDARRWQMLAGLWLAYASFGAVATGIAPLVAPIEHDLGMTHAAMGSVMGAWQLVYIFSAVPCGILLDRIGGGRAVLLGLVLIAVSAAGRGLAQDYWTLLLAVMVFGLGGPLVSSGAPKLVAEHFSGSERGLAMGIYMTGPALGGVASLALTHPLLLPWLGDWRGVMLFWAGMTTLAGLAWLCIARRAILSADEARDAGGLVAGSGQADTGTGGLAAQAVPSQVGAMRTLLAVPAVQVLLLMSVGVFLYNHGLNNWLPELLRTHGLSVEMAGYWATIPTVVGIVGSLLIPRLATPPRRMAILAGLALAALLASVLLRYADGPLLLAGLFLQGVARSSLMTILVLTLVELPAVGERRAGVASGLFFSAAEVGGMLGPLGMGLAYDLSGGFSVALTTLSVTAALLLLGCVYLRRATQAPESGS